MNIIHIVIVLVSIPALATIAASGERPIDLIELGDGWMELKLAPNLVRNEWTCRIFQNEDRDEMLTFACYELGGRPLVFDEAWEFAPSGYPFWAQQSQRYSVNPGKTEWFEPETYGERKCIIYSVVNEHESGSISDNVMAIGFVASLDECIYFVQHTSRHPITELQARSALQMLIKRKVASD